MDLKELQEKKLQMASKIVGDETVLVPLQSNVADLSVMFTLNEVGSFIWEQLDSATALNTLVDAVVAEFDVDKDTAQADVTAFIAELESFMTNC